MPFAFNAMCQQDTVKFKTRGIAYATENKDTLYVLKGMTGMMHEIWDLPHYVADKPVIIPVNSLDRFYGRRENE